MRSRILGVVVFSLCCGLLCAVLDGFSRRSDVAILVSPPAIRVLTSLPEGEQPILFTIAAELGKPYADQPMLVPGTRVNLLHMRSDPMNPSLESSEVLLSNVLVPAT